MTRGLRRILTTLFAVRHGEAGVLGLMAAAALAKGVSTVSFETAANTLFLVHHEVALLPWLYVATAALSMALGAVYVRSERRLSPIRLFSVTIGFLAVATAVFYLALLAGRPGRVALPLMVWRDVHYVLLETQFWAVAGLIFTVRQSKRLLGPLAAGGILGYVIGGLLIPPFVTVLATRHLLGLSLLATLACLMLLRRISAQYPASVSLAVCDGAAAAGVTAQRPVYRHGYVLLIFTLTTSSLIAYYVLDFLFYQQVNAQIPSETRIAAFFGIFAAVYGIASLAASALLTGRILARFGVVAALMTVPFCGIAGMAAAALLLESAWPGLIFAIIVLTKLLTDVVTQAVEDPAFRVLYQPLPPDERLRVIGATESVVGPAATGIAGALLILATDVFGWGIRPLALVYVAFLVIALLAVLGLRQGYLKALARAAVPRQLKRIALDLADPASRRALQRGLDSPDPVDVVNALQLLETANRSDAVDALLARIEHPAGPVRSHVFERLEALAPTAAAEPLRHRLSCEVRPDLRAQALRAYAAAAGRPGLDQVRAALDDDSEGMRHAAMIALLRHDGLKGWMAVAGRLTHFAERGDSSGRSAVARLLKASASPNFRRDLALLLADPDPAVCEAAARVAGATRDPAVLPGLVAALDKPSARRAAAAALQSFGESAVPAMADAFQAAPDDDARRRLLRLAAKIGGPAADALLRDGLRAPSGAVRHAAIAILNDYRHRATVTGSDLYDGLVRRELAEAHEDMAILSAIANDSRLGTLADAVHHQIHAAGDRVLLALALTRPGFNLPEARHLLGAADAETKAKGLEILDTVLSHELREALLPLFEEGHPAPPGRDDPPADAAEAVEQVLRSERQAPWTLACAIAAAARHDLAAPGWLDALVGHPEGLVRETACWAVLSRQRGSEFDRAALADRLDSDPEPAVARLAAAWRGGRLPSAPVMD